MRNTTDGPAWAIACGNWLEGWSSPDIDPKIVHMTRGIPTMAGFENIPYADEWRAYLTPRRGDHDGSVD
ncbi:MAG: hypothetical protein ACI9MJ_000272 [Alphaproteobacteria bacterium]